MTETDLHPELRPLLFSIAYRMIGSVSEAEDIVQEAFLRYHRAQPDEVANPKAYLSAITTRLAIDHLRSARVRREQYVGPWLPEPLLTDEGAGDPSAQAELADSLSLAFLVLLERLSPVERAAFLLREVFAYPYDEIAEVIGKSEGNVRQLVSRARRHVDEERPRFDVDRQAHEELTDPLHRGDPERRHRGPHRAAGRGRLHVHRRRRQGAGAAAHGPRPRARPARFMVGIARPDRGVSPATLHPVLVNGVPGRLARDAEGNAVAVLTLDVADGR